MCDYVTRQPLPMRRKCITQKIKIGGQTVHYSVGLYDDGSPGELFIEVNKAGAALRQWCGDMARTLSVALQHGTPLETILRLYIGTRCDPCGIVIGHDYIKSGLSIMDVVARDLAITFLQRYDLADDQYSDNPLIVESSRGRRSPVDSTRGYAAIGNGEAESQVHSNGEEDGSDLE